jgi:hypothetical protein
MDLDADILAIDVELMNLAKRERELLTKQTKLRCLKNKSCSITDLITNVQIG